MPNRNEGLTEEQEKAAEAQEAETGFFSSEELDSLFDEQIETVRKVILGNRRGVIVPEVNVLLSGTEGDGSVVAAIAGEKDEWPSGLFDLAGQIIRDYPGAVIKLITMISEGWRASRNESEDQGLHPPVSQRADKVEVLIATSQALDQRGAMKVLEIVRESGEPDDGTPIVELRKLHHPRKQFIDSPEPPMAFRSRFLRAFWDGWFAATSGSTDASVGHG